MENRIEIDIFLLLGNRKRPSENKWGKELKARANTPDFDFKVKNVRSHFKIDIMKFKNLTADLRRAHKNKDQKTFSEKMEQLENLVNERLDWSQMLQIKAELGIHAWPSYVDYSLLWYLISGEIIPPRGRCNIVSENRNGERKLFIQVFGDTTIDDIKKVWKQHDLQKGLKRFVLKTDESLFSRPQSQIDREVKNKIIDLFLKFQGSKDYAWKIQREVLLAMKKRLPEKEYEGLRKKLSEAHIRKTVQRNKGLIQTTAEAIKQAKLSA